MVKEYTYDAETDTYIGALSSCLQMSRLTKYGTSVYDFTKGEINLGSLENGTRYIINLGDNMCPTSAIDRVRNLVKSSAKCRTMNDVIPYICMMIRELAIDDKWTRSSDLIVDRYTELDNMLKYVELHYINNRWQDNILMLDVICRKMLMYIHIPDKLPVEWYSDIYDKMIYITCKNPIIMAMDISKYIRREDQGDSLLPKLELTHSRTEPHTVSDAEGNVLTDASLYTVVDSRFKGLVIATSIDKDFIDTHDIFTDKARAFCYHIKGLVLLDSIDIDDRNMALYCIIKPSINLSYINVRDRASIENTSERVSIPYPDEFGNLQDIGKVTHMVIVNNNNEDSDLIWLRRFHKYYTLLTLLSSVTGIYASLKSLFFHKKDRSTTDGNKSRSDKYKEVI